MNRKRAALFTATVAVGCAVSACAYRVSQITEGFALAAKGESRNNATQELGTPGVVETPDQPFMVYASVPCTAPCAQRLWWEHPVLRGVEAWSMEFDSNGRMLHKAYWLSL